MGLPLQVRRESFAGVGHPETFTKTNTLSNKLESPRSQSQIEFIKNASKTSWFKGRKIPRAILHASVIALAVFAVSAGQVKTEAKLTSGVNVAGKTVNTERVSLITTGAVLSEGTSSMVDSDVSQRAKDLNAQVVLATAGDDFLAKKLPVITSGAPSREIITYTVKDGDTLSSLATKFNITSDTIKWANDITDETSIKPGDNLTILPVSGVLYTGTGTDNLDQLATQYQANSALIDSFNSLDGKSPVSGQKIIIPDGVKPSAAPAPTATIASSSKNTTSVSSVYNGPVTSGGGSFANTYAYGYCTWYVAGRRYIPNMLGNANQWPYNAPRAGMAVGSTPRAGAAGVAKWGNHVVYIERVEGGTVYYSDMNGAAGWGRVGYGSAPASNYTYIY